MEIRKWLLIAVALIMLTVCVLTWGSLGSAVMIFCLILMAASVLYQRFLTNRAEDDFRDE